MKKHPLPTPWRWLTALSLVVLAAATSLAQQTDAVVHERMKKDIFFLASPECEGRDTGSKGIAIAGEYIVNNLKQAGLKPGGKNGSWYQPFVLAQGSMGGGAKAGGVNTLVLKGPTGQTVELKIDSDFKVLPNSGSGKADGQIVFAGYGVTVPPEKEADKGKTPFQEIAFQPPQKGGKKGGGGPPDKQGAPVTAAGYDDFKGLDVKGKIVVVLRRVPRWENDASPFTADKNKYAGLETKIATVEANKPAAIIVVNDRSEDKAGDKFITAVGNTPAGVPVVQLRRSVLDMMMVSATGLKLSEIEADIDRDLKPRSAAIKGWSAAVTTTVAQTAGVQCKNIVAVLEGAGPLADETVCIGAHYDHMGYSGGGMAAGKGKNMYPGADDNGSGSTTIMELARRFAAIKDRQGRRLVFIWFSGEEKGLKGSQHYCKEPLFPLEKTVAMVNLDMVGRLKEGKNPELYAEGFDTGKGLKELLTNLNKEFGFTIVGPHKQGIYGRSDQASFYNKGVPGVFFFTDFHADYHKPGDTADKINVAGMAKVASLTEKIVAHLSTVAERPAYVAGAIKGKAGAGKKAATAKLGLTIDPNDNTGKGALISAVAAGGPAAKAGLMVDDRIITINNTPIPNATTYQALLTKLTVGTAVEVVVLRKGAEMKVKVTPE